MTLSNPYKTWINSNMQYPNKDWCHDSFCLRTGPIFRVYVLLLEIFNLMWCCGYRYTPVSWQTHELWFLSWARTVLHRDRISDECSGAPGLHRRLDGDSNGAGWQGGMASISEFPLCSKVTCSPLLCSQAENCPFWHELPWPFGTVRRTYRSNVSTIHLQLTIICCLLLQI